MAPFCTWRSCALHVSMLLAAVAPALGQPGNLLGNGDFETGGLTPWSVVNADPALDQQVGSVPAFADPPLFNLAYRIRPGSQAPDAGIRQTIGVTAGQRYKWSVDVAAHAAALGGVLGTFELRLDGVPVASVTHNNNLDHQQSFGGFFTPAGSTLDYRLVFNRPQSSSTGHPQWFIDHAVLKVDRPDVALVMVTNNTGADASDLHVRLSGTGGQLFVSPATVVAWNCPTPTVSINAPNDEVTIDWGALCVPDGMTVGFLAISPLGPLRVVDAYWTPSGTAAAASDIDVYYPDGVLNGSNWSLIEEWQIVPLNAPVYSPSYKPPGNCWTRICCYGGFKIKYRAYLEQYKSQMGRLVRTRLIPLTPGWITLRTDLGTVLYEEQIFTKPFPGEVIPVGGPKPNPPSGPGIKIKNWKWRKATKLSDDGGFSFHTAPGLSSTFLSVSDRITIPRSSISDPLNQTFPEVLQALAPQFVLASQDVAALVVTLDGILLVESEPELLSIRDSLQAFSQALQSMSQEMQNGYLFDTAPFLASVQAWQDIAANLPDLEPAVADRLTNAAEYADMLADAFEVAGNAVASGLGTIADIDNVYWALRVGFPRAAFSFAQAMDPHVRIEMDLGPRTWGPDESHVEYEVYHRDTMQLLDEGVARMSERGGFEVPIFEPDVPMRIWFKPDTYLSRVIDVPAIDGLRVGTFPMWNGDANGDNCADAADIELVILTDGFGGEFANDVPPTDLNYDGVVERDYDGAYPSDLAAFTGFYGQRPTCGQAVGDCNYNGAPDADDIADGGSSDDNGNGVPDECEGPWACCAGGACMEVDDPRGCNGPSYVCDVTALNGAVCLGDTDGNGIVNAGDRGFVSANIGQTAPDLLCQFDLDGNGVINAGDRGFVSANIGLCIPLPPHMNGSGLNPAGNGPDPRFPVITGTIQWLAADCADARCGAPANDACSDAPFLGSGELGIGSNVDAASDAQGTCGSTEPFQSVWYRVVGDGAMLTATTCLPDTDFDTIVQVFCGSCQVGPCVGGNDDVGGPPSAACDVTGIGFNLGSRFSWCTSPGQEYLIALGGYGTGAGAFGLDVSSDGVGCGLPADCAVSVGACCTPEGACRRRIAEPICTALGGAWQGAGSSCADVDCGDAR